MKTISITELNKIMDRLLNGYTMKYGQHMYHIFRSTDGVAWVNYMPCVNYTSSNDYSPVGWYGLLRIN